MKKTGAVFSYIGMGICICMGFYKMFVYENSDIFTSLNKNSYVNGDAYNYIINAGYSTAWFVLAGVCAIVGLTFVIANYLDKNLENKDVEVEKTEVNEVGEAHE